MAKLSKTVKRVQPSTTFSKRLRQARERAGLTQTELGLRVGMDPSAASPRMNQYEKGIHEPPHAMVKRLAEELGVPAAFLFVDDDRLADLLLLWTELGDEGHEKLLRYAKRQGMDRSAWMLVRACLPGAVLFAGALVSAAGLAGLNRGALAAGLFDMLRWVPIAMAGVGFLLIGAASYRLWRWERGMGPSCVTCGGPLGHEREGRANRGGAFRRCYACGKAVNHRYYAHQ